MNLLNKIKWKQPKPSDTLGFQLWSSHNLWQREIKKVLRPFDLTHVQFILLASLGYLETVTKDITQHQLATFSNSDIMMTSKVLRKLVYRKLIIKKVHPTDPRAYSISLTSQARSLVKNSSLAVKEFEGFFFSSSRHPSIEALTHCFIDLQDSK